MIYSPVHPLLFILTPKRHLNCIKGGGACQTQEKLVAYNAKRFFVVSYHFFSSSTSSYFIYFIYFIYLFLFLVIFIYFCFCFYLLILFWFVDLF